MQKINLFQDQYNAIDNLCELLINNQDYVSVSCISHAKMVLFDSSFQLLFACKRHAQMAYDYFGYTYLGYTCYH